MVSLETRQQPSSRHSNWQQHSHYNNNVQEDSSNINIRKNNKDYNFVYLVDCQDRLHHYHGTYPDANPYSLGTEINLNATPGVNVESYSMMTVPSKKNQFSRQSIQTNRAPRRMNGNNKFLRIHTPSTSTGILTAISDASLSAEEEDVIDGVYSQRDVIVGTSPLCDFPNLAVNPSLSPTKRVISNPSRHNPMNTNTTDTTKSVEYFVVDEPLFDTTKLTKNMRGPCSPAYSFPATGEDEDDNHSRTMSNNNRSTIDANNFSMTDNKNDNISSSSTCCFFEFFTTPLCTIGERPIRIRGNRTSFMYSCKGIQKSKNLLNANASSSGRNHSNNRKIVEDSDSFALPEVQTNPRRHKLQQQEQQFQYQQQPHWNDQHKQQYMWKDTIHIRQTRDQPPESNKQENKLKEVIPLSPIGNNEDFPMIETIPRSWRMSRLAKVDATTAVTATTVAPIATETLTPTVTAVTTPTVPPSTATKTTTSSNTTFTTPSPSTPAVSATDTTVTTNKTASVVVYPIARYSARLNSQELVERRRRSLRHFLTFQPVIEPEEETYLIRSPDSSSYCLSDSTTTTATSKKDTYHNNVSVPAYGRYGSYFANKH